MSPSEAVACERLERVFGERRALRGLDLHVEEGELVLLTGPNGAGKTTLLRLLATVIRPSGGSARVGGHALPREAAAVRPRVGYLGHESLAYAGLTARENLQLYAALYGVDRERVEESLARVGLAERAGSRVSELSRGMRQRLALARACLHRPALLLLDEPTAGLDEEGRALLRQLLADGGRTVLAATHEPAWFDGLRGRVVALEQGRVVA
jgi:heme exporter protein A